MLRNCLICKYSLDGLPDEHTCPECGFKYERQSTCVYGPRKLVLRQLAGVGMLCFALMIYASMKAYSHMLFVFPPAIFIGYQVYRNHGKPPNMVIISKLKLTIVGRETEPEVFDMREIQNATWSKIDGSIRISGKKSNELIRISYKHLQSHFNAKSVVSIINKTVGAEDCT